MKDTASTIPTPAAPARARAPRREAAAWRARGRAAAVWAARLLVAGAFIAAAAPKVLDPAGFMQAAQRYELLPTAWLPALAITLPWLEAVAALALLAPRRWSVAGAVILLALLGVFTGAALSAWWRGLEIACGCFTTSSHATPIGWWLFVRNAGLLALLLLALLPAGAEREP